MTIQAERNVNAVVSQLWDKDNRKQVKVVKKTLSLMRLENDPLVHLAGQKYCICYGRGNRKI